MKTTHVKWEDMWEKDFCNYPGWLSVLGRNNFDCYEDSTNPDKPEIYKTTYFVYDNNNLPPGNPDPKESIFMMQRVETMYSQWRKRRKKQFLYQQGSWSRK